MADRSERNGLGDREGKEREERPTSGRSRGSAESKKSIHDAVSKMTVKALKEFRLSEPSEVDTVVTGGESEGLVPGATFTQEIPSFDPQGVPGAQTLLSEDISGQDTREDDLRGDVGGDDEDLSDEESGSEGETDMVVLDPDHVRTVFCLPTKPVARSSAFSPFSQTKKLIMFLSRAYIQANYKFLTIFDNYSLR